MSVKVMAQIWELDLPQPLKLLALALGDWADDGGGGIYPSMEYVAWKVGAHRRTVQRQMRTLERIGLVEHEGWHRNKSGQSTRLLRLHTERVDKLPSLAIQGAASETKRSGTGNQKGWHSYVTRSVSDPSDNQADVDFQITERIPRTEGEPWAAYLRRINT